MIDWVAKWGGWLSSRIMFIGFLIIGAMGVKWYEGNHMPVVPEFVVERSSWDGDTLSIWGKMDKVRDCTLTGLLNYYTPAGGLPTKALTSFPDGMQSRPPMKQNFGPIDIYLPSDGPYMYDPGSKVTVWARHNCHPGWYNQEKIGIFIPEVKS